MGIKRCLRVGKPIEVLSKEDLLRIHEASLTTLGNVGVGVDDVQTLKQLGEYGCEIDEVKRTAKITEELVSVCLKKTSKIVAYGSRASERIEVGKGDFVILSSPDDMYVLDIETGVRRPGTIDDCAKIARLVDALEYFHVCCIPVVPKEPPPQLRSLYGAAEVLRNTGKHFLVCPGDGFEAEYCVQIAAIVAGGEVELARNPLASTVVCPSSPLHFPQNSVDVLRNFVHAGLPIVVLPAPLAGVTAPVTMAGSLAVANAEALAGVVIAQIFSEGSPVIYGGSSIPFDMRYGITVHGSAEYGLFSVVTAQLARFYGLPSYAGGAACNANLFDGQAGYEKMFTMLLPYLGGADMIVDAGLNANSLVSYDEPVIQNEISGMVMRVCKGFEVSDNTLATDIIAKVGIGGNYLAQKHTRDYAWLDFGKAFLSNRASYERWFENGAKEIGKRGIEKAKEILATHNPPQIDPEIDRRITEILSHAKKRIEMG